MVLRIWSNSVGRHDSSNCCFSCETLTSYALYTVLTEVYISGEFTELSEFFISFFFFFFFLFSFWTRFHKLVISTVIVAHAQTVLLSNYM